MQAKGWVFYRVLLNRFFGGVPDGIARFLPESDFKRLKRLTVSATDSGPVVDKPQAQLQAVHYSWLLPELKELAAPLQEAMIASLPSAAQAGICQNLQRDLPKRRPSPAMREFLAEMLARRVHSTRRLPAAWLPTSPLTPLLSYDRTQLQALINYMGLRDLAAELKQIVNKNNQQILLRCLTSNELQLLKYFMSQKETLAVPRLELKNWTGDCAELRKQLHLRGMARLGKALSGVNPDLLWHLLRVLPVGRANILKNHLAAEPIPQVTADMLKQLAVCMKYLTTQKEPS